MDELYKNLVKLKPKDNVPFKCIGCGECCKHVKEQVPVETLDAFRIAYCDFAMCYNAGSRNRYNVFHCCRSKMGQYAKVTPRR